MSLYFTAAKIARNVEGGAGLRKQLYSKDVVKDQKHLPEINFLVNNALQKKDEIDELIAATNLTNQLQDKDVWLARILTAELVLGKKSFKAFCPVSKTIYSKKAELKAAGAAMKITKKPEAVVPRYVRVDVNQVTMAEVHRYLEKAGYIRGNYSDYKAIPKDGYCLDIHVPALLVFHMKAAVHSLDWVTSGCLILQDKSSCLVAPLLAPHPCSTALDMCAAPGYKTHHLASHMSGLGKIIAVDKDEERYDSLQLLKKKFSLDTVFCINGDVLENPVLNRFKGAVEYILLDPPCSGSGMAKNYDFTLNTKDDSTRYDKLHNLQVKMLKSALSDYPAARRVTYSTCSITEQENESVIDEVVRDLIGSFSLVDLTPFYPGLSRGRSSYKCGSKCIRLSPDTDSTNGFFIALFERLHPPALPVPFEIPKGNEQGKKRVAQDPLLGKTKKSKTDFEAEDTSEDANDDEDSGDEEMEEDEESSDSVPGEPEIAQEDVDDRATPPLKESSGSESSEQEDADDMETDGIGAPQKPGEEGVSDDDEEGGSEEETSEEEEEEAKEAVVPSKNAPGQYGSRQYWAKGHKRFGKREDPDPDKGSESPSPEGKSQSDFVGFRGGSRGRGGDWRGRGNFRGGDRRGRGNFGGGDGRGRGNFRGGDGRGRGNFRGARGRGNFRGGEGRGRGNFRGGDRRGRGNFRGGRGGFRGNRGGGGGSPS